VARASAAIAGFGHFAERAEVNGLPCFNTSLQGRGDRYPDPDSVFLTSEDNYVLLTMDRVGRTMVAELKSLRGAVLDRREIQPLANAARGEVPNDGG
jgi:hypothetical protein